MRRCERSCWSSSSSSCGLALLNGWGKAMRVWAVAKFFWGMCWSIYMLGSIQTLFLDNL